MENQIRKEHITYLSLLLFALSFVLFLLNNTHEQLWYDETLVLYFSGMNVKSLIQEVGFNGAEAHPPLFHLIIKALRTIFGESLLILRGFSALCGSILILLVFRMTNKILNFRTAVFAAVILLLNPIIIAYTQELRMYIPATLLVFINITSFYTAIHEKGIKYWIIYTISAITGLYTHYYFVFTFIISAGYFLIFLIINRSSLKQNKNSIFCYIIATLIPVFLFIPWLPAFLKQREDITYAVWLEQIKASSIFKVIGYFFTSKFARETNPLIPSIYTAVFVIIFFIFGMFVHIRKRDLAGKLLFLSFVFITPLSITFLYSVLIHSIISYRYFILYFPFFVIILAYGLSNVPFKFAPYILLIVLLIAAIPSTYMVYTKNFNGALKDVSLSLKQQMGKGDAVITADFTSFLPVYYYLDEYDKVYLYFHSDKKIPGCFGINLRREASIIGNEINDILERYSTVWIVENQWTRKITEFLIKENPEYHLHPDIPVKSFDFEYSWQKNRISCITRKE